MDTDVRIALVTVPVEGGGRIGEELSRTLVEERLAACVNRIPNLISTYRWEDNVEVDGEELLIIKTTGQSVEALTRRVAELHPYKVPEVLILKVESGLEAYLGWVKENCC